MGHVVLRTTDDVWRHTLGSARVPWELPDAEQPPAWRQSRLRPVLKPCLSRAAAVRPTATALLAAVERLYHGADSTLNEAGS